MIFYIILLIVAGIILLILEILILPGLIAGVLGSLFLIAAILWSFNEYGTEKGIYISATALILSALAVYFGLKSKMWNRFSLKEDLAQSKMNLLDLQIVKPGEEAVAVSALRPMGTIMIGDLKVEAQTNGELIPENSRVIIVKVLQNKVIVKSKNGYTVPSQQNEIIN